MFSSRQIFDVAVTKDQLAALLKFAMDIAGTTGMFTRDEGRVKCAWAEPVPGVYALGRGSMRRCPWSGPIEAAEGWTDYPFDYDPDIIARILWQWAKNQTYGICPGTDGSVEKGLRCMSLETAFANKTLPPAHRLQGWSPSEAVLVFAPAWHQYDK